MAITTPSSLQPTSTLPVIKQPAKAPPAAAAPATPRTWSAAAGQAPGDGFEGVVAPKPWDYPKGLSSGVFLSQGENPHPIELIEQASKTFPGSKTFLYYKSVMADPQSLPDAYFAKARAAGVVPQLGFESGELSLPQLRAALEGKGALREKNADGSANAKNQQLNAAYTHLAAWADHLKGQGPVIFRPLSEMNDASGNWEMGKPGNTPKDFAAVWNGMHELFTERGATNLRWSFDVLAVQGAPSMSKVKTALLGIPSKNIDNVAVNPYAMRVGGQFESFSSLVQPWLQVFKATGHGNTRPVVSEMGVSNNPKGHNVSGNKAADALRPGTDAYAKLDAQRAQWIHEAFAFARTHDFASMTYFTQMNTNWRVDPGSLAFKALQKEIAAS